MKSIRTCVHMFALAVLVLPHFVEAANYLIDPVHSHVGFTIRHLVSKVPGEFKDFSGEFEFDPKKIEASRGRFAVKAASISTNQDKRDEHLRSPDFFDSAKYPEIVFEVTRMMGKPEKLTMTGDLTLRGVRKPVSFDVEFLGQAKDPGGKDKVGFTARSKINRRDFGLTWNKVLDSGGVVLGDDVELTIQVEANGTALVKK